MGAGQQVSLEPLEIVLEGDLVEFHAALLEEAVFEVVEVEVYVPGVEGALRIADAPVQALRAPELKVRQQGHGLGQQGAVSRRVFAFPAPGGDGIVQDSVAQVLLEVGQAIVRYCEYFRNGEALRLEVGADGQEGGVLVPVSAYHAYAGGALLRAQAEVAPAAASRGKRDQPGALLRGVIPVQRLQNVHPMLLLSPGWGL